MRHRFLVLALATAAALSSAMPARAETHDDMSFSGMFKADRIDGNKDGMVSKAEFLAMMEKAYDMKAKEMKAKTVGMSMEQFKAFSSWLSRGEKN
jgi:hypothetical protein